MGPAHCQSLAWRRACKVDLPCSNGDISSLRSLRLIKDMHNVRCVHLTAMHTCTLLS